MEKIRLICYFFAMETNKTILTTILLYVINSFNYEQINPYHGHHCDLS